MKHLRLDVDAVRALLDSMETNDHCTLDYDEQIQQLREQIAEFAGDGGLILQRPPKSSDGAGIVVNVEPGR